ncbi:MAG: hypothetical protein IPJ81_16365 [Chitinophagaceae bacterium]|nr:hypothetical protein [Chitinophagaceae bacterium]
MKKTLINFYIIFVIFLFAIFSCKENNKNNQSNQNEFVSTSSYYKPSKLLDSLAGVFLDTSKCKDCINEVFIDKVYDWQIFITFRSIPYEEKYQNNYLNKRNPLFYFIKNDQKFFIITGTEDYIITDQQYSKKLSYSDKNRTTGEMELIIKFKIFEDSIHMLRVAGGAFCPEMNQDALPPDDSIPSFDPNDYR